MSRWITLLLIFAFISSSLGLAQDLSLKPSKTKLVNQDSQTQGGVIISQRIYQSGSSRKQIIKFYRRLLANQGFLEDKNSSSIKDSGKRLFFFAKQDQGSIAVLNFPGSSSKKELIYSVITHDFSVKNQP